MGPAQAENKSIPQKLADFSSCFASTHQFSGAVLVGSRRSVLYQQGYGYADRELRKPNEPDTKFILGSVTKQFVATAILELVAEKKLGLEDSVLADLPQNLIASQSQWRDETVLDLLVHASGIPDYINTSSIWGQILSQSWTSDEIIQRLQDLSLLFEPGQGASYSNTNYMALGKILERAFGRSWPGVLESEFLTPLGLSETGIYRLKDTQTQYAIGYMDATGSREAVDRDPEILAAVGDMYSSARDLYRWEQTLFSTQNLVPSDLRAQTMEKALNQNYSAGAEVRTDLPGLAGQPVSYRTGHLNGFSSALLQVLNEHLTIVVLSNVDVAPVGIFASELGSLAQARSALP